MEKTVVLSAGHSLEDPGAICPWDQNITEAKLTMAITQKAATVLRMKGIGVLEVPNELDLQPTIDWINSRPNKIDLAVEVHINSFKDGNAYGVEGWYYNKDQASKNLAARIVDGIMAETGLSVRGVKDETTNRWGLLGFIHYTKPLAALIECGFITNKMDMAVLATEEGQWKVAAGIARGMIEYMGLPWSPVIVDVQTPTKTIAESAEAKELQQLKQKRQAALDSMREYKQAIDLLGAAIDKTIEQLQ